MRLSAYRDKSWLGRLALVAAAVCVMVAAARAPGADIDSPEYWRGAWKRLGALGKGFVVWESNRGGAYRIWYRNLDGSGLLDPVTAETEIYLVPPLSGGG